MKTDIEKSRVRRLFNQGFTITQCARKCHMDRKTAARILHDDGSPTVNESRVYRTRKTPSNRFGSKLKGCSKTIPNLKRTSS